MNLKRNGVDALLIDNFIYNYQSNKNRLASITNAVTSQTYNYSYDNNGNVTSDQFRDISGITYSLSNLTVQLNASGNTVSYWYNNNGNRFRKQESNLDEIYVLGINSETEAVFNADGSIKFFNINAARPFGINETICRQTLVSLPDSTGVNNVYLNAKYKFTGKERDTETGYDYFGARYYDSRIGKLFSVDPLADKDPSISPYSYAANNPILYIDINGDSIQVSAMQSQLQSNLISGLVQTTGIPLYITETGMLAATPTITIFGQTVQLASAYGSTNGGGSQEAASFLNFALGNSSIVNVVGTNVVGSQGGGQLVRLNQNQIEGFINGTPADLNSATMGYGMVFLHELTHSNLGQFYFNSPTQLVDPSPGIGGTGFVVDFMNRIRGELGQDYGQRLSYEASQGAIFNYIPFNSINGRTRITFRR